MGPVVDRLHCWEVKEWCARVAPASGDMANSPGGTVERMRIWGDFATVLNEGFTLAACDFVE